MREATTDTPPTMAGKTDEQLAAEAKRLLKRAESIERDASAWKWAVAERVAVLREHGWTYQAIASAIGFSKDSARNYHQATTIMIDGKRPSFYEAQLALGRQRPRDEVVESAASKLLRDAPAEQIERLMADLPPERQRVVSSAASGALMDTFEKDARKDRERRRVEDPERQAGKEELAAARAMVDVRDGIFRARRNLGRVITDARYLRTTSAFDLAPDVAEQITRELGRLEATVGLLREVLDRDPGPNFDAALAQLLAEEGAS